MAERKEIQDYEGQGQVQKRYQPSVSNLIKGNGRPIRDPLQEGESYEETRHPSQEQSYDHAPQEPSGRNQPPDMPGDIESGGEYHHHEGEKKGFHLFVLFFESEG